jgi:hypothetical protein
MKGNIWPNEFLLMLKINSHCSVTAVIPIKNVSCSYRWAKNGVEYAFCNFNYYRYTYLLR